MLEATSSVVWVLVGEMLWSDQISVAIVIFGAIWLVRMIVHMSLPWCWLRLWNLMQIKAVTVIWLRRIAMELRHTYTSSLRIGRLKSIWILLLMLHIQFSLFHCFNLLLSMLQSLLLVLDDILEVCYVVVMLPWPNLLSSLISSSLVMLIRVWWFIIMKYLWTLNISISLMVGRNCIAAWGSILPIWNWFDWDSLILMWHTTWCSILTVRSSVQWLWSSCVSIHIRSSSVVWVLKTAFSLKLVMITQVCGICPPISFSSFSPFFFRVVVFRWVENIRHILVEGAVVLV